jgi:hypothetical protein
MMIDVGALKAWTAWSSWTPGRLRPAVDFEKSRQEYT